MFLFWKPSLSSIFCHQTLIKCLLLSCKTQRCARVVYLIEKFVMKLSCFNCKMVYKLNSCTTFAATLSRIVLFRSKNSTRPFKFWVRLVLLKRLKLNRTETWSVRRNDNGISVIVVVFMWLCERQQVDFIIIVLCFQGVVWWLVLRNLIYICNVINLSTRLTSIIRHWIFGIISTRRMMINHKKVLNLAQVFT